MVTTRQSVTTRYRTRRRKGAGWVSSTDSTVSSASSKAASKAALPVSSRPGRAAGDRDRSPAGGRGIAGESRGRDHPGRQPLHPAAQLHGLPGDRGGVRTQPKDVSKHLETFIRDNGWQTYGQVVVEFAETPALHVGIFRVQVAVDPDAQPRPIRPPTISAPAQPVPHPGPESEQQPPAAAQPAAPQPLVRTDQ